MTFRFHRKAKVALLACMLLAVIISLCGCAPYGFYTDMPFNGPVNFHTISATIPETYIRDSTNSTEDLWVFEHGGYKEYILMTRSDISGDIAASIENYAAYMKEQGASSAETSFMGREAVRSTYTKDEVFCQEMLFAYDDSFYAIALCGGDEAAFEALLNTVKLGEPAAAE